MEMILCQDVPKLGKVGAVVKVADGYGRNFLIPRKLACIATPQNLRRVEQQKAKQAREYDLAKNAAEAQAEKLGKASPTVTVEVNDLDKLYGSVSEVDIVKALEVEGFSIDKKLIMLDKPLEELGIFEVKVRLHPEVIATVRLWVAKK